MFSMYFLLCRGLLCYIVIDIVRTYLQDKKCLMTACKSNMWFWGYHILRISKIFHSEIPAFAQVLELWQKYYVGINVNARGSRVEFNMIHLKKITPHCKYLTGLLAIFKDKVTEGSAANLDPILTSVRFSYLLRDWTDSTWMQDSSDSDFFHGDTLDLRELGTLPFGALHDPIR